MRDASLELKRKMYTNTEFYQTVHIVFADGREKDLGKEDFYISGNAFNDGPGTSSFPLGEAMAKQITLVLVNDDDRFSDYDFYLAKMTVYVKYDLSETAEAILLGTFTVTTPESYGAQVTVEALDDMYKGNREYSTSLKYPATVGGILRDSCLTCGISLISTTFPNMDYTVASQPENITHRQLWGMCAMIAAGNARMDEYNRLEIINYDFSYFETNQFDGGVFDSGNPYQTGTDLDGGSFEPWDTGDEADGGDFAGLQDYHFFYKNKIPTIATDDVVITGIQTVIDETTYIFGSEGYVLNISNQLIEENPQEAVNLIGKMLVGAKFRPFSIEHIANPLVEFGDICYIADRKSNVYQSIVTDINFSFFGSSRIQCAADNPLRNSSQYYSESTKAIVAARKETEKQLTAYDLAIQQLTTLMSQSFGIFKTEEKQEDGSIIYYLHNKPELATSSTIWKMTADALAVSTDGGETWNAGIDSEGNAVVNVLSAIGINADWINVGLLKSIQIDNGNGKFTVDPDGNATMNGAVINTATMDSATMTNATIQKSKVTDATIEGLIIGESGYSLKYYNNAKPPVSFVFTFAEASVDDVGRPYLVIKSPAGNEMISCGYKYYIDKQTMQVYAVDTPIFNNGIYAENAVINSLYQDEKSFDNVSNGEDTVDLKIRRSGAFVSIYGSYHTFAHTAGETKEIVIGDGTELYMPTHQAVRAVGYYGKRAFVFAITTEGKFIARNASESDIETSTQTDIKFRFDFFRF